MYINIWFLQSILFSCMTSSWKFIFQSNAHDFWSETMQYFTNRFGILKFRENPLPVGHFFQPPCSVPKRHPPSMVKLKTLYLYTYLYLLTGNKKNHYFSNNPLDPLSESPELHRSSPLPPTTTMYSTLRNINSCLY